MNFENILESIQQIDLSQLPKLNISLQNRTKIVGMGQFTSSTNPIATFGIIPCLGIGISGGGINYFEHATPHDFKRGGLAISRMNQVIQKFRENNQSPKIYLFRNVLNSEIESVIEHLISLGLIPNDVIFCNISHINMLDTNTYVGIYNNKPFWFHNRIRNQSYNHSRNYLNFNFSNTNIQKLKQFSVGDYVMIKDIPNNKYIIIRISEDDSIIQLYNITQPYSYNSFAFVGPDRIYKTEINNSERSYSNVVKGKKKIYPIPPEIREYL